MCLSLSTLAAQHADVLVLMDTSGTILPWFEDINTRILSEIARRFVRPGDTFHLVSFNSRVHLEVAQSIRTEADVSRIVSRFMLLFPLGQNSDFLSGLQYTHQYISSLTQSSRKIIIIISDGIFNPPPSSPYASLEGPEVERELDQMASRIRADGWDVYYVKIPFPKDAVIRNLQGSLVSSGTTADGATDISEYVDISQTFTNALDIRSTQLPEGDIPLNFVDGLLAMPEIVFPAHLGKRGRWFSVPFKISNPVDKTLSIELTGVFWNGINILERNTFLTLRGNKKAALRAPIVLPDTLPAGETELAVTLAFSQNLRVVPQSGTLALELVSFSFGSFLRSLGPVVSVLLLVIIAAILILLLLIVMLRSTSQPAARILGNAAARGTASAQPETAHNAERVLAEAAGSSKTDYRDVPGSAHSSSQGVSAASKSELLAAAAQKNDDAARILAQAAEKRSTTELHYPARTTLDSNSVFGEFEAAKERERLSRLQILADAANKSHHQGHFAAARSGEKIQVRANGNIMLELKVRNQNPHIGKRNIHVMKSGSRLSLGGGHSAFWVFLVKFPARIAEVRFDGTQCSLAILKPQYFPYAENSIIEDCIGKEITIVSDKDYEITFMLHEYEDPVIKLNRLLTSIH